MFELPWKTEEKYEKELEILGKLGIEIPKVETQKDKNKILKVVTLAALLSKIKHLEAKNNKIEKN